MIRAIISLTLLLIPSVALSATTQPTTQPFTIDHLLYSDDFQKDTNNWTPELENGGAITYGNNTLDIDVPAGATLWFNPKLTGPLLIQYQATAMQANGLNDRVSDLNCFWMATDSRSPNDIFATKRSGKFADYNQLKTYYVGQGGNNNTTTRFRRYIGDPILRPLLPQYDLKDPADMLTPNQPQLIQLVADGPTIQYYRDHKLIFDYKDNHPYTTGHFAFRTTKSHIQFHHFRVYALTSKN
jgi:hypothetical protein